MTLSPSPAVPLPWLRDLRPWSPGPVPPGGEGSGSLLPRLQLASNENPRGPGPRVLQAIQSACSSLNRYPDPGALVLRERLAGHLGVPAAEIVVGNGSNELLTLLTRLFLGPGLSAVMSAHAFAIYPILTRAAGAEPIEVPAVNFGHDLPAMVAACNAHTRLLLIANPNNPTGTWAEPEALARVLPDVPHHVVVVLDEAYAEYVVSDDPRAGVELRHLHPNVVVTRTFSKAYGLASLRVGAAVAPPSIARWLDGLRDPYNCNAIAQAAAAAALDDSDWLRASVDLNTSERERLRAALRRLGLEAPPSQANFLLVRAPGDMTGRVLRDHLFAAGIDVAAPGDPGLRHHVRITVGTPPMNDRLLQVLGALFAAQPR